VREYLEKMKILLTAKNEAGKTALLKLLDIKKDASLTFRLLLAKVKFNAELVQQEPLTVYFKHGVLEKIPYNPIQADMIISAVGSILKYLDASTDDVLISADEKEVLA